MSTSPHHSKRSLKPNPMSASPSQLTVSGDPATGPFNTSSATTADPFGGTPYAVAPPVGGGGASSVSTTSPTSPTNTRKRRASGTAGAQHQQLAPNATIAPSSVTAGAGGGSSAYGADPSGLGEGEAQQPVQPPPPKKGRTNTPWTAAEEQRLKIMRDAGNSWSEIAKVRC
ncbi:hypothetical protein SLS56_001243 [Neofusicoccum ribis]|uniref:Myb-like domain-containing protein n=1 Tax=Neofusicoccum ribis TaxID=45134 RepID=A0ABR3TA82_9PEZI